MHDFFFYGTLCHPPLLETVLGRAVELHPARLADHAVHWAAGHSFPMILPRPGAVAEGMLVRGMSDEDVARLDFYEGGFAYHAHDVAVGTDGTTVTARVFFPDPGLLDPGAPWSLADWVAEWGEIVVSTAGDFMAAYGERSSEELLARYPQMLLRAASRLRARRGGPAAIRHAAGAEDVAVHARHEPYARFFAVEEYDLRHRRFDGSMGALVNRAVFILGDAVTVLPYDPRRDRVMVVEQFRAGPFGRGDAQPWQLEPIAGRIDAGETPEHAARREALEEAGLALGEMRKVSEYYPSPGALNEYLYSYVALTDLPDDAAGLGGLEDEHEDIRAHVLDFDALMALVASGEVANGPLILTALWLQRERAALRAEE
ncbi:gamma-glutamylcyclotransferase [Acidimangrovimonas pyrenivorans]|uniref:ADP-ribose pyrophosphatase n=1 Tax=Acidimangrovimonas pyrenivorans TaxID=2030798 RepID=A0ABV7AJN1_9RHOB